MSPRPELWVGPDLGIGSGSDSDFEYFSASETGSEYDPGREGIARAAQELKELAGDNMTDEADAVQKQIWQYDLDPSSLNDGFDDYNGNNLHNSNLNPPELYRQAMKQLDENYYARKEYAPSTEGIISMAESSWRMQVYILLNCNPVHMLKLTFSFCKDVLGNSDWQGALRGISFKRYLLLSGLAPQPED